MCVKIWKKGAVDRMKIKLAILEKDKRFLERIVSSLVSKYSDRVEIYSFTDQDIALENLQPSKIDVFLANDAFDVDVSRIPARCCFAYFVDYPDIDLVRDQPAICKFQKLDLLYKQILRLYSETASSIIGFGLEENDCRIIAFASASGGVGTSTMAAACAVHFAAMGRKTLYLDLQKLGSADIFFHGPGQYCLSDLIYALKSKKGNLHLKAESCVKRDASGVFYFSCAKYAMDMLEVSVDEIRQLIEELRTKCGYDYIILDTDFSIDKKELELYCSAHAIVMVGDGSGVSNHKTAHAHEAILLLEERMESPLTPRMYFLYNKVNSKTGHDIGISGLRVLGGTSRYGNATEKQLLTHIASMDLFDKIF